MALGIQNGQINRNLDLSLDGKIRKTFKMVLQSNDMPIKFPSIYNLFLRFMTLSEQGRLDICGFLILVKSS